MPTLPGVAAAEALAVVAADLSLLTEAQAEARLSTTCVATAAAAVVREALVRGSAVALRLAVRAMEVQAAAAADRRSAM